MAWPIESAGNVAQFINNFHITVNWKHLNIPQNEDPVTLDTPKTKIEISQELKRDKKEITSD